MDGTVSEQERAYWTAEEQSRALELKAANVRGDAPHLLAGAELRLREAKERLAAMQIMPTADVADAMRPRVRAARDALR